jgi:hypothetical protein
MMKVDSQAGVRYLGAERLARMGGRDDRVANVRCLFVGCR